MKNLFALLSFFTFTCCFTQALEPQEIKDLSVLSQYRAKVIDEAAQKKISSYKDSKFITVKAYATGLLFKSGTATFDQLFTEFAVQDYAKRDKGEYNFIPGEALQAQLKATEELVAKHSLDKASILPLLLYVHYRNRNEWVRMGGKRIAIARVFRTAFLESLFHGGKLSTMEVANKLDKEAIKLHRENNKGAGEKALKEERKLPEFEKLLPSERFFNKGKLAVGHTYGFATNKNLAELKTLLLKQLGDGWNLEIATAEELKKWNAGKTMKMQAIGQLEHKDFKQYSIGVTLIPMPDEAKEKFKGFTKVLSIVTIDKAKAAELEASKAK